MPPLRIFGRNGSAEKEEEMIWRGKQYVHGIKLYYRKMVASQRR